MSIHMARTGALRTLVEPYPIPTPSVLYFDGTGVGVTIPNTGNRMQPAQAFTWEMWFKLDTYEQYDTLAGFGVNNLDIARMDALTSFRCNTWSSTNAQTFIEPSGFPPVNDGEWHHIAIVWDGVTGKRFALIDGVQRFYATMAPGTQIRDASGLATFSIGSVGNRRINGWIRDVRLWNVARTAGEIVDAMDDELTGSEPGLLAFYPLDEGNGTTAHDLANGYDGEISGAEWQ